MLKPDQITCQLAGKTFVSKVYYFEHLDSTNNYAKENDLPDGSLVITDSQTKGRGRFERVWYSAPGENLTFSISRRFDIKNTDQFILNCCVSLSAYKTINKLLSRPGLSVKWPNDIVLNGHKLAGILIEKNSSSPNYIIGFGINVNQKKFNQEFLSNATSISLESGKDHDINELLCMLIVEMDKDFGRLDSIEFDEVFGSWKSFNHSIGKEVIFVNAQKEVNSGTLEDILRTGEIVISVNNERKVYRSGEIILKL